MSQRFHRSLSASLLILTVFFTSRPSFACGPFTLDAVFTFVVHPEYPLEKFAGGEVGVLQPTFARSYLFAVYRNFKGGFSAKERAGLVELWKERLDYTSPDFDGDWPKPWLEARQKIAGIGATPQISAYRHREQPNEYETYVNCQKDAFEMAATTLLERARKFGADSSVMKDWVSAQDSVFANCSEGQHLPAAPPADADALIRADRAYQIAAAMFYSGSFDEAKTSFDAIAREASSPWRQTAAYLSARALVRKASLGPADKKSEALAQAEELLNKVLTNPGLASMHPAAARLLNVVRVRLHPEAKLHELAQALMKQNDETLKQDLWDYTILTDQFLGDEESTEKTVFPASLRKDDLTDWIVTVPPGEAALNHSLDRWRETSSLPWLIVGLTKVDSGHPQAAALVAAAEKIDPNSPAFASASFHQVRLAMESGKLEQARAKLDELLAKHKASLPASSVNLFLSMRMRLASNLTEFLTYAQRRPAGFSWNEDEREMAADLSEDSDLNKSLVGQTFFDLDGASALNSKLPLSVLQQAAESKVLPAHLRRDVAQAAWLRAVLLDDSDRAKALAPTLKTLAPQIAPLLDDYLSPQAEDDRKFSALYTWLKTPGLQPIVHASVGRRTPLHEQDVYRDNWWCAAALSSAPATTDVAETETEKKKILAIAVNEKTEIQYPVFLSEAQKTSARNEHARLTSFGAAPNYLCRQAIAWAEHRPTDPRVPEALHLAVKSTRYGCTDKENGKWSKAAYDVLHKRYPNSPWAKKTPYWFKD